MIAALFKLHSSFSKKRKIQSLKIILAILLTTLFDILGISSILPFIAVITSPEIIINNEYYIKINKILNIRNKEDLVLYITILFSTITLSAALVRVLTFRYQSYLSFAIGSDISINIIKNKVSRNYIEIVNMNSSEVISLATTKSQYIVSHVIMPIYNTINSTFLISSISILLVYINWKVAILSLAFFIIIYISISNIFKPKLKENSIVMNHYLNKSIMTIQEILGGIKELILRNKINHSVDEFIDNNIKFRNSQISIQSISNMPKYIIEGIGFAFLAWVAYFINSYEEYKILSIPIIGVVALSGQKLLPAFQQLYQSITTISGSRDILQSILIELNNKMDINYSENSKKINFEGFNSIELKDISYAYPGSSSDVIRSLSVKIKKGDKIGIIGETGSGKSTLIDIISGLIKPDKGKIYINNKESNLTNAEWRNKISQIPQKIFLKESSILSNIAFGEKETNINLKLLNKAIENSQLDEFIKKTNSGIYTKISERGGNLSGGQIQRIAIARALYRNLEIITLDEPTSALDKKTEENFIQFITNLDNHITVIAITHNINILKNFDAVYRFENGNLLKI